jgi:integrase
VAKTTIHRLLSRRDIPLRKTTLWRMLYETAARAAEILALNVEDFDLEHRRAPVRSKGGAVEWVYWDYRSSGPCRGDPVTGVVIAAPGSRMRR